MKLPQTFVPEKNLDDKVEELKNCQKNYPTGPVHVGVTELLRNDMELLYGHPEKRSGEDINSFLKTTFHKIVNNACSGSVKWKPNHEKDEIDLESYVANTAIINAEGEEITIPVMFYTRSFKTSFNTKKMGYLHLGDQRGPCRNTTDPEIRRLARAHFKIYDIEED